jgi:mannose-6-phosphate isomerase-like protein (cupin superfamily)
VSGIRASLLHGAEVFKRSFGASDNLGMLGTGSSTRRHGMLVRKQVLEPIDFGGLKVFDYTAALAGNPDLGASVAVIDVPSGAGHAESHSLRSDKYYLVIAGAVDFVLGGATSTLAAGDFCHVRKGEPFSYRNADRRAARLVVVHTPPFDLADEVVSR